MTAIGGRSGLLDKGTFGAEESAELAPYRVDRDGWGLTVAYEHPFTNREDPGVEAGLRPLVQTRRMTYRYHAPFSLSLRLEFLDAGGANTIGFVIQPETAESTRLYATMWRDDLGGDEQQMAAALAFEQRVLDEDLALASRYDELCLPIDSTVEVHTRADRGTLELRRVLAELVAAAAAEGARAPRTRRAGRRGGGATTAP